MKEVILNLIFMKGALNMKTILVIIACFFSISVLAADKNINEALFGNGSCIDVVCSKLPKFLCDDDHELKEIAKMCVNNRGGTCVEAVCQRLPRYQCDDVSELREITQACSGLKDTSCMDSVCAHVPKFKCDDLNELKGILNSCKYP